MISRSRPTASPRSALGVGSALHSPLLCNLLSVCKQVCLCVGRLFFPPAYTERASFALPCHRIPSTTLPPHKKFPIGYVGNKAFASHFEDSVAFPVHRVTHARDPVPHMPSAASGFSHVGTEVFFNKASSAYKVCARGEDPSCAASVVVASGVDDHASYMGESFAAKHLECALAPSSSKSLEAAAKALAA